MAKRVQLRRGNTTQTNAFTGAVGEVTVDTDKDVLVVHDGTTAGGFPVAARANVDGTISLIKKDGTSVGVINASGLFNNTLTSTNTDQALTAAQGKVLQDSIAANYNSSFGVGQTWQNVTAGRTMGTTYTNSTGRPILVNFRMSGDLSATSSATVGGVVVAYASNNAQYITVTTFSFVVPNGSQYSISGPSGAWVELR